VTIAARDAALDLLLGASCVGCGRPGRLLCPDCAADLPSQPYPCWPTPTPAGLAEPWAAAPYDGTVRALVLGLKERRLLALARPLAALLAAAVAAELPRRPVLLVPVPSRRASVRARGHDPTWTVTAGAAQLLRRSGLPARSVRLLRVRPGVRDQSGLDAVARAANLSGAMRCPGARVRRVLREGVPTIVVCDDVITTGSTAREAQRALEAAGLPVARLAAVAATPRRVRIPDRAIQISDVRLSSPSGTD
jgi:predicted amidophosphoribosyltransferase